MTFCRVMLLFLAALLLPVFHGGHPVYALDPRFELNPQALHEKLPAKTAPASQAKKAPETLAKGAAETTYTVKPGDHLMKILARDFGMGNNEAEALIPEIKRRNQLGDARRLRTGMRIIIPLPAKSAKSAVRPGRSAKQSRPEPVGKKIAGHQLALFRGAPGSGNEGIGNARVVWEQLVPAKQSAHDAVSIKGKNYSLDLAPDRFPLFPAADGGKILIEAGGRLSPIVKSLIQDNDPGIRFVAYTPRNHKRFFADLLAAAGFYSVEENFTVAFGADPKLTVTSDFKIENDADSSLQQNIFLLNIEPGRWSFPPPLSDYLAKQGFRVIDLYPAGQRDKNRTDNRMHVITDKDPSLLADRLMSALDLGYEQNKQIDLLSMDEGGVSLRVRADRYFEKSGEKFVVSVFKGDLENYTLLRILESQRYHVIVLTPDEDFRSIAGKFLAQLHLPGSYAMQDLLASGDLPYNIKMSGLMVNPPGKRSKLFLTSTQPDRIIGELLELNGYTIHGGKEEVVSKDGR
jgi:hypothetical protein